jgi:hypothetical protein
MSREHYLVAQQIYRGWALLGIAEVAALGLTVALAVVWRHRGAGGASWFAVVAACAIGLSLVIFFLFTLPANRATQNWTLLSPGWELLRARWEYSHAAGALLHFSALTALVIAR